MLENYKFDKEITFEDIFDGRLESYGIHEKTPKVRVSYYPRYLTDGQNYLSLFGDEVVKLMFTTFTDDNPDHIFAVLEDTFDIKIYSDLDPQYWGYESEDELRQAWVAVRNREQTELYKDIIRFVEGQPNNIEPGTDHMTMAITAKNLIADDPNLGSQGSEETLMKLIENECMEGHTSRTPPNIAEHLAMATRMVFEDSTD